MNFIKLFFELYNSKRTARFAPGKLKKLQEKRLRYILRYAYDNSPYYRKAFQRAGINDDNIGTSDISRFPTIDKEELFAHYDDIVTDSSITQFRLVNADKQKNVPEGLHIVHSSGSAGEPKYFLYDDKAWNTMLIGIIRAALWDMSMPEIIRFLAKKPKILYIAAADGSYGGALAVGDGVGKLGRMFRVLDIKTPVSEWCGFVSEYMPDVIIGYPSAIRILGETLRSNGVRLELKRIDTCGEPLGKQLRSHIEKLFGTQVFNVYGASESLALGVESGKSGGMYLFDDLNFIEYADDGIYLTSLYNRIQPLIRYKLSDRLEPISSDTEYPFSKISSIVGRTEDVMWFENNAGEKELLHPLEIEGFCIKGAADYQFIRHGDKALEMLIQTDGSENEHEVICNARKQVGRVLARKSLDNIRFTIKTVSEILPDMRTGKKALVVKA